MSSVFQDKIIEKFTTLSASSSLYNILGSGRIQGRIKELEHAIYEHSDSDDKYLELFFSVYSHFLDDIEFDMYLQNIRYTPAFVLDGGSYLYLNNSVRTIYHNLFKKTLINKPLFLAKYVECGCYYGAINMSRKACDISTLCRKWDTNFRSIYEERCAVVLGVLEENNTLFDDLEIDQIYELCCKPCQELCPEVYKKELDMLNIRRSQKIVEKTSNLFKCPACHGRSIVYREDQRRSLDEASGFQCKCKDCGKEFYIH